MNDEVFRVLCLDGGGSKGCYSLGVLSEIEALLGGKPLSESFDLIFGTSTGAIITALLGLGNNVDHIVSLYMNHIPRIMGRANKKGRSEELQKLATHVFGDLKFDAFKTHIGIVCARWAEERQMIFKSGPVQAHGMQATFVPGFGCKISDAVVASCSAYPLFERKFVKINDGTTVELLDGGYCANNPTLYALAEAEKAFGFALPNLRVISIGVGSYPEPKRSLFDLLIRNFFLTRLLRKTLAINTGSMETLSELLFRNVPMVRINNTYNAPETATDLTERNLDQLERIYCLGRESYRQQESKLKVLLAN